MIIVITIILVIVASGYTYLVLNSWPYTLINFGVFLVSGLFINFRYIMFSKRVARKQFMFTFIELFILNYDVQKSVEATLNVIYPLLDTKAQKLFTPLRQKYEGLLLLEALRTFFAHQYYESFLDIVVLINERGGEIMKVSAVLLYSIAQSEARMVKMRRIDITSLIKYLFNYIFIMIVGVVFRYALDGFMNFTNIPQIYIIGNELLLAVLLISLTLLIENTIRREKDAA